MKSPLLRHEIRRIAHQRRAQMHRRAALLICFVPLFIFAGLGLGQTVAHTGPWPAAMVVFLSCCTGWFIHSATRPLL